MAEIVVRRVDLSVYEVEIGGGGAAMTKLAVTASEDEMHELGLGDADPEELVRELVEILVEHGAT